MRSLERLVSDHHRQLYARDKEYSVLSEELKEYSIERVAAETLSTGIYTYKLPLQVNIEPDKTSYKSHT